MTESREETYRRLYASHFDAVLGNDRRAQRAAGILTTVREWRVLQEATGKGAEYAEAIWGYADQAVAGQVPKGYGRALACEG